MGFASVPAAEADPDPATSKVSVDARIAETNLCGCLTGIPPSFGPGPENPEDAGTFHPRLAPCQGKRAWSCRSRWCHHGVVSNAGEMGGESAGWTALRAGEWAKAQA